MVTTRSAAAAQARSRSGTPVTQPTPPAPVTATAPSIDPVSKTRTITHMNKDHTDDMSAILRHFSHLSASQAADAELLDLDLKAMTIRSASGVHTVPFAPPMDSWDDRRARLVAMTADARTALGLDVAEEASHAPAPAPGSSSGSGALPAAPRYVPPQGTDWISFAGVSFYFLCAGLVYGGLVTPGSPPWRALEAVRFPQGPVGFIWIVESIFLLVLGIHVAEAWWMDRSRLAPAGVPRGSKVWCLWVGNTFLEGVPAYRRWDRVVKAKTN
ncbi:integral membrane [Diaporthe amygdali]|uniref:integral membrane n=1 Tax=Phomopsis amygdali TaxID=1214568 RepID=UPI0022FEA650|nr:integral membrane [Diaporthe amygdali]KAJ0125231.1 integral membrane [Diaporthe amygdali]